MIQGAANLFQVPFATDGTHNLEGFRRRQDHLAKIRRTPREMAAKTTAAIGHQQQQETNRSKSVPMVVAHEADVMPRWRLARQTDGTAAAKIQSHRTDPDSQLIKIWRHPPAVARSRALRPNSSPEALPQAAAARPTALMPRAAEAELCMSPKLRSHAGSCNPGPAPGDPCAEPYGLTCGQAIQSGSGSVQRSPSNSSQLGRVPGASSRLGLAFIGQLG